jgi:cold-inducible RNA-binding protein
MKIYVGNLSFQTTDEELHRSFEAFGQVESATVIKDKVSGQSRGFGFVEMPTEEEGKAAVAGMNGKMVSGRAVNVSEARPREDGGGFKSRGPRGGGGGGGRNRRPW